MARVFAREYGLARLSIGDAIRMVLNNQAKTELANQVQKHLNQGLTVPDELAIQCLEVAVMSLVCSTRGWGPQLYPNQRMYFCKKNIYICVCVTIHCDPQFCVGRLPCDQASGWIAGILQHYSYASDWTATGHGRSASERPEGQRKKQQVRTAHLFIFILYFQFAF